jgi:hypothetical protein
MNADLIKHKDSYIFRRKKKSVMQHRVITFLDLGLVTVAQKSAPL